MDDKVLDVFKTLINELNEHDDKICIPYEEVLKMDKLTLGECEYIDTFLDKINTHSKKITNKDESVFDEELLMDVDLKKIWDSGISEIDQNNIWKYLQTFCIININLNSSKELQKLLSGETKEIDRENRKDVKDLKKIKKLKESIDEINTENQVKNQSDPNQMNNIFENTGIGQLAKEIAEGLDFEEMLGKVEGNSDLEGDTEQSMESVMQNIMNPGNFMNLFSNINEKVQEKISTGALNEDMLSGEAQNLYGNFQNNPMFQSMMNNPELKKFQEQMNQQGQAPEPGHKPEQHEQQQGNDAVREAKKNKDVRVEKLDHKEPVVAKNETQARLQKKLAKREEEKKIKLNTEQKKTDKTDNIIVEKTE